MPPTCIAYRTRPVKSTDVTLLNRHQHKATRQMIIGSGRSSGKACSHSATTNSSTQQPEARRLYVLALTGSIGMGKSAVSDMFRRQGIPVLDADQVVHELYAPGGAAVGPVAAAFPAALVNNGIDRGQLKKCVLSDEAAMKRLEALVHPLVAEQREKFLTELRSNPEHQLAVLDIPLLFETGGEGVADGVAVVSAPAEVQQTRVLSRPGMTQHAFDAILRRQVPDAEKRSRATFVIDTGVSLEETEACVARLVQQLTSAATAT